MRSLTLRRALGAALVPVLFVGVTACGSDTKEKDQKSATKDPFAAKGEDKDLAAAEPKAGGTIEAAGFTKMMLAGQQAMTTAKVTMDISAAGTEMKMTGQMDFASTPPKRQFSMDMPGGVGAAGAIEIVMVDGKMYMSAGPTGQFMEMDPAQLGGEDFADQMDPSKSVEDMLSGITKVTFVGDEDKAGVSARRYTVAVDTAKVKSLQDTPGIPASLSYDTWLDDEDRVVAMEMDMGALGATTVTFTDFGTKVDITAPDPSKVIKAPAGLGGMTG